MFWWDKKNFLTSKIAFFVLGQGAISKRPILLELRGGDVQPPLLPKKCKNPKSMIFFGHFKTSLLVPQNQKEDKKIIFENFK